MNNYLSAMDDELKELKEMKVVSFTLCPHQLRQSMATF